MTLTEMTYASEIVPIVVTDLDGTLLDHETYDYSPALPTLDWIADSNIPLILASSKTASEIFHLKDTLGLNHPAIVENGGGVWAPDNYFPTTRETPAPGTSFDIILEILNEAPAALRQKFDGFCDWTTEKVASETGLTVEEAVRASDRAWSIPGYWRGNEGEFEEFAIYMKKRGIHITQGGRFMHLMGQSCKGMMLDWLVEQYRSKFPEKTIVSVALGDAPNDVSMLFAADHAIVIPNLKGIVLDIDPAHMKGVLHHADKPGPAGWNDTLLPLLKSF